MSNDTMSGGTEGQYYEEFWLFYEVNLTTGTKKLIYDATSAATIHIQFHLVTNQPKMFTVNYDKSEHIFLDTSYVEGFGILKSLIPLLKNGLLWMALSSLDFAISLVEYNPD